MAAGRLATSVSSGQIGVAKIDDSGDIRGCIQQAYSLFQLSGGALFRAQSP